MTESELEGISTVYLQAQGESNITSKSHTSCPLYLGDGGGGGGGGGGGTCSENFLSILSISRGQIESEFHLKG